MYFSKKPMSGKEHRLGWHILERVNTFKYLGVFLSEDLKWEGHIIYGTNRCNQILAFLKRVLFNTPGYTRLIAYKSLCRSILDYALEVWDPYLKKDIHQLEMIQNRAIRFVSGIRGVCSITEARDALSTDSLQDGRKTLRKNLRCKILASDNKVLQSQAHCINRI